MVDSPSSLSSSLRHSDHKFLALLLTTLCALLLVTAAYGKALNIAEVAESDNLNPPRVWKRNAELINGLIGMDLDHLSTMGKRGNAELVNGLIGMDLSRLSTMGRRKRGK